MNPIFRTLTRPLTRPLFTTPTVSTFAQTFKMSTTATAAPKPLSVHEWLCILPDQSDALPRRLAVRSDHLAGIKKAEAEGFFTFGGAFFADKFQEGVTPDFKGSIMIALGDTKEEVVAKLKEDVYTKNNVWDWEKVEIFPFRTAVRVPLSAY